MTVQYTLSYNWTRLKRFTANEEENNILYKVIRRPMSNICELISVDNIFSMRFEVDAREYAAKFRQSRSSKKVSTTRKFAVV